MKQLIFLTIFTLFLLSASSQSLSLQQCIDSAVQNNYNVKIAGYEQSQTKERILEAKTNLLPKINSIADYRYYTNLPYQLLPAGVFGGPAGAYKEAQFGLPHNLNINAQISYPLYNPALRANIKTIQIAEEITALQYEKSKEDIVFELSNVYYNGQILRNQMSFIDSNIINSKRLLTVMQILHQQKMATGTDVDKINLQLSQLVTQKETVESQYNQVLNILNFLIGRPLEDKITINSFDLLTNNSAVQDKAVTEIKLAEKQILFLQKEKEAIYKSKLPVINLNGFYGTTGYAKTGTNDFLKFYPLGYVGAQLIVPLYSGNITQLKIKGKEIELEKAAVKLEMIQAKNSVDKANNFYQLAIVQKNLETITQQINFAQSIYKKTLLQRKEGLASLTDVLLADSALREAQQSYINALVEQRRAELENRKLTGNLLMK